MATSIVAQLNQLSQADLIRVDASQPELAYGFKHALTQDAAYQSILHAERRIVHQHVAHVYEQLFADRLDEFAALLAHHFAKAGDDEKSAEYAIRAADQAAARFAYTEARQFYAQALDALKRLPDTVTNRRRRVDVTIQYVTVSRYSSPEQNLARLAEIEPLARDLPGDGTPGGDPLRRARVHYQRGMMHFLRNAMPEATSEFEQVLSVAQALGDQDLTLVPSSIMGRSLFLRGYFGKAQTLLAQAAAVLEAAGNWSEWVLIARFLGATLSGRGHYSEGQELLDRVMARAKSLKSEHHLVSVRTFLAFHYLMGGDWLRAREAANTLMTLTDQSGDRLSQYFGLNFRCWAETGLGDYRAASESQTRAHALAAQLGGQLLQMDWAEALHARIALMAGEIENALTWAQQAATLGLKTDSVLAIGLAERVWGEALARCNPPRWEQADAHLAASLRAFEEGDAVLEAARTHVAWGRVLMQRGEFDHARTHFEQAAAQFEASGLEYGNDLTQSLYGT